MNMVWRGLTGLAAILILVAAGAYMGLSGTQTRDISIPLATVKQRDLVMEVNTIGVLDAAASHMVTSELSNARIIYLIDDGSRVKTGDILVRLDPSAYQEDVERLSGDILMLKQAVAAKAELLEWEKNQVEKEILTAQFQVKVARLDLEQLKKGEGPLELTKLKEQAEEQLEARNRYQAYLSDLKKLQEQQFDFTYELVRAEEKLAQLDDALASALAKHASYRDHVLPALIERGKAEVEQAETSLEQTRKGGVYKIAQATASLNEVKSKLENTRKALELANKRLEKTTICAPSSGIVILYEAFREGSRRKPRIGDVILQNQPILYLPDVSSMIVKTKVREVDLHKVDIDQACDVFVDAYPEEVYSGTIAFIGSLATEDYQSGYGAKYFQVTVNLADSDSRLRPGMTARINILTEQAENILSLPVHAVFGSDKNRYCYRFTGKTFERAEVETGRQNLHFLEITAGLNSGDRVSMVAPSGFLNE
jgi:HlyD family secretion protein